MAHQTATFPEGQFCPACEQRWVLEAFSPSSRGKQGRACSACNTRRSARFGNARRVALRQLGERHADEYRELYDAALTAGGSRG